MKNWIWGYWSIFKQGESEENAIEDEMMLNFSRKYLQSRKKLMGKVKKSIKIEQEQKLWGHVLPNFCPIFQL